MGTKLTTNDFIERSKIKHGDEYNYNLVNYININTKVKIICSKHGIFEQIPNSHLSGQGCSLCYGTPRKKQVDIINQYKIIHNNKYDYSLVEYKNKHSNVKIICPEHGIFEQCSRSHLRGHGCPSCVGLAKYTNETFIKKCIKVHGNRYNYSSINIINSQTKIKIICPEHGIFEQIPTDHLNGSGCSECSNKLKHNNETFIEKCIKVHGNKYDYSLVNYKNNKIKVKIICPIHGLFEMRPDNHMQNNGCPCCCESRGETIISIILNNMKILFEKEKKFKNCKNINLLSFDFYLSDYNLCIEYDGKQHYKSIKFFGGDIEFEKIKVRDYIKTKFCSDNNIKLLRIKYNENINKTLNNFFLKN